MANHTLYGGYNPSYGELSSVYPSSRARSTADPYALSDPSLRYLTSSDTFSSSTAAATEHSLLDRGSSMYHNDPLRYDFGTYSGTRIGASATPTPSTLLHNSLAYDSMKRQTDALYHQSVLGNHNSIGQSEAYFSTNPLAKRPRYETASNLPVYPQRPGEKSCAHYMLTRTCKFGDSCKFDHPIWVPEGGIPDWKEAPIVPPSESLPERPGEPDCPYFLKTQSCKFGFKCKFNHPKDKNAPNIVDVSVLPERPSEPPCAFYLKTGSCKFGIACKFHHPKDIQIPSSDPENSNGLQPDSAAKDNGTSTGDAHPVKPAFSFTPALFNNSKGLPMRQGEVDCPFYLKTDTCKFGITCRYNHPEPTDINPPAAAGLSNAFISNPVTNLNFGVNNPTASFNPAASIHPAIDPRLAHTTLGVSSSIFPQRPGMMECDYYMKRGICKFGENCKFHHPIDRSAPMGNVKLTLAGLPRREGAIICPFYLKTATCMYGVKCRFDHPPPGEAIKMASTVQETTKDGDEVTIKEEVTMKDEVTETSQE